MKDILDWASQNSGLSITILIGIFALGTASIKLVYLTLKHLIRMVNIAIRGWPPYHLDADGDFRPSMEPDDN